MARVRDSEDLLVHELRTILAAEQASVRILGKLQVQASDRQLKHAFERHRDETAEHVKNVESALRILGAEAVPLESPGVAGLEREHEESMEALDPQASPALRDLVICGSAAHTELYELGAYESAVEKAELMGEDDVAEFLEDNLHAEQDALDAAKHVATRLARSVIEVPARA